MPSRNVFIVATIAFVAAAPGVREQARQASRDLDGVWTYSTLTPLERPPEFAGRPFLTGKEAAEFEKRTIDRNDRDSRDPNPEIDVNGAYNEAWSSVDRTSRR